MFKIFLDFFNIYLCVCIPLPYIIPTTTLFLNVEKVIGSKTEETKKELQLHACH